MSLPFWGMIGWGYCWAILAEQWIGFFLGTRMEHKLFFLIKLVGHPRNIPANIPGYPAQKFGFPGFRRTYWDFWRPHLHVEDPHSTRRYLDQKVWIWFPFLPWSLRGQSVCVRWKPSNARIVHGEGCVCLHTSKQHESQYQDNTFQELQPLPSRPQSSAARLTTGDSGSCIHHKFIVVS